MTLLENMLGKYYKGETSLEEEKELKSAVINDAEQLVEQKIFSFYQEEAAVPKGLESDLFAAIEKESNKKKGTRRRLYSIISAAAMVVIVLSVFLDVKTKKKTKLEDQFFVMEQALFQVSESLQPMQEQDEMLVLWVDDDVEIIIN
ncbi:hypothetical protein [uncultured Draconibacterium sp.]|uniref:hypothetical protein n=1 Tax=uncultured Draconibacterium sp. TaxID=1573823 RepID=UPI003260B4DD